MNVKFPQITSYKLHFTCVFTILVKFDTYFLGLPREIFFGVNTDDYIITSLALGKCKIECIML